MPAPTIGVFDSGFGGLTVLRSMLPLIPGARYLYLGDTARLPYGAKSRETVARYAVEAASFLLAQGAEMLVVACNTASALALDKIAAAVPIPVLGVIEPGVHAALAFKQSPASPSVTTSQPSVLVLATLATVQSAAYTRSCAASGLVAYEKACPLLVPLVEEGWLHHPVTAEVVRIYLAEALAAAPTVTTLVLGCTHYPLLLPLFSRVLAELNHPLHIVDSASATAADAVAIAARGEHHQQPDTNAALTTFYATDSIAKFQRLGSSFLGQPLPEVHLIDLGG